MEKYLFIRVESIKGEKKFRFLPNQKDFNENDLKSTVSIRIQDGKCLPNFEIGEIYIVDNSSYSVKTLPTSSSVKYSIKRWRCYSLTEVKKTLDRSSSKERFDAWEKFNATLGTTGTIAEADEKKTDSETLEKSYFGSLRTEFIKCKPTVKNDGFYMSDSDWMILIRNIKRNINTLITGPTGSGKTTAIKLACEKLGIPCSVYDMGSMFDPISSLLGVHRLSGGSSTFDYAKFAQDIQKPGVILLDELSRAPIQSNNILFPCLDDRRTLPVEIAGCKDIRSITVHPEVCFIATANIGAEYTGTNVMDRALQNRFFPIELNYLDKTQEAKVLEQRCGISTADASLIVRVATEIRNIYKKQELSISVSTRETLMVGSLVKDGWTLKEALCMVFLPLFEGGTDPTEEATERGKIRKLLMTF